MKIILPSIK